METDWIRFICAALGEAGGAALAPSGGASAVDSRFDSRRDAGLATVVLVMRGALGGCGGG